MIIRSASQDDSMAQVYSIDKRCIVQRFIKELSTNVLKDGDALIVLPPDLDEPSKFYQDP